ncbi:MAG: hypothetical protein OXB84_01705 [Halobacteriovoraceae bacterium]|nr:hypothetical protein [Halobacteriovoraceae bacterium]
MLVKRLKKLHLLVGWVFLGVVSDSWATSKDLTNVTTMSVKEKKWSGLLYGDTSTSVNTPNDESRNIGSNALIFLNYKLPNGFLARFSTGVNKDYMGDRKLYMNNSYVALSRHLYTYGSIARISGDSRVYLPTNKPSYKGRSYRGGFFLAPKADINLAIIGLKYWIATYSPTFSHSFYQYNTAYAGAYNTGNSIGNSIRLGYAGIRRFYFSLGFSNTHSWSTSGKRKQDTFRMDQEVSYSITPESSIALGHLIGGTTFKDDGVTSNVVNYDPNRSYVYTSLAYKF